MKKTSISIIVLFFLVNMIGSCKQDQELKDESRNIPSVEGQTLTLGEGEEQVTLLFAKDGKVRLSGSEFGDGVEATYEQKDEEIEIFLGSEEIELEYDGQTLKILEYEEYRPEGYNITEVSVDTYEARAFISSQGDTIQYRLFIPKDYNENTSYSLVLFHHGAGGTGNDNIRNLEGPCPREWAGPERQADNPCFIVAPQIPRNEKKRSESGRPRTDIMNIHIKTIHEIIDALEKEFPIDKNREYVTGLSMGGECTWMSMIQRPDRFAAAAPICGGDWIIGMSAEERGKKFAQLPMWIFHGEADDVVSVDVSREAVKALKAAGGNPKYTEYPGVGHDSWTRAYRDQKLIDWLFAQSR